MEDKKKSPLVPILIGIIVLLLAVIGYLIFNTNEKTVVIQQQVEKIEADSAKIQSQLKELEEMNLALNRVKMEMTELGKTNDTLEQEIAKLNKTIEDVRSGRTRDVNKLNAKLAELKKLLDLKDAEIATWRLKADSLTTEVGSLNQQKSVMNDSISALRNQKSELAQQVAIASVLKAENIRINVITKKDKELAKDEYRAKDIYKLKISFTLAENKVARKDSKSMVMRLIEPSGSVLYDAALGGGFFTNSDGKEIPYTDKKNIKFDNSKQAVSFIYVKGNEYKSGSYKVELYGDGNKIGESSFVVK
jgi:predicted  nucleic acid-binding Zn-ribbon protein